MGFWSRVGGALGIRKDADEGDDRLFGSWGDYGQSNSGIGVNSWSAMQHGPVMACVAILSEDVAKIPLGVWTRTSDGGKKPATGHPLQRLLRTPNDWQTRLEFIEMMQAALVLCGNAYAVVIRDGRGRPLSLVPVHPDRVSLYESPGLDWFYMVSRNGQHEMAVLRDLPIMIPQEDVFHLRWLSQYHSLLGSRRVTLAREPIGLGIGLEQHQARFTGQGARVGGALKTDQKLAKEIRENLRGEWQRMQAGARNSGATAVLEQGLQWEQLGLSMVDAQWIESREFQLREVARVFQMPPYKLGIMGSDSGPSMVQQNQEYLNSTISGYCERWKAKLEKFFDLDGEETFVEFDYAHFLQSDMQTRFTAKRMAVGGPWMSPNEARAGEGLPEVPHGDDVLQAANMVKLGTPPAAPSKGAQGSDTTGAPGAGGDGDPERLPGDEGGPNS